MDENNFEDDIWKEFNNTVIEIQKSNTDINLNLCSECNSTKIIVDLRGATVCSDCGMVQGFVLDKNPEWINGDDGGGAENDRCGNATSYFFPQSSLGTNIKSHKYDKIKMVHDWSQMPYKERSLYEVFQYIDAKCDKAGVVKSIINFQKSLLIVGSPPVTLNSLNECCNSPSHHFQNASTYGLSLLSLPYIIASSPAW